MKRWQEFRGALMLLTRLPATSNAAPAACVWAYPLVGALVGAIGAAVFAAARLAFPPVIAALLAITATILVTGALHEDGLADTADGFGGGRTRDRKLAIMRDSRIGSYGALALMLSLALRVTALAQTPHPVTALITAATLSRGAMLIPLLVLSPARPEGLGAALADMKSATAILGLALAAAAALAAPAMLPAAAVAALLLTALTRRQIGGYTGDTLGATAQIAECAALIAVATGSP